ncbi:MAG: hypothetical protein ACXVQT_04750, partial [Actinomycetota bacterium]
AFRQLFDLDEARRRSEEAFEQGRSTSFHMPWMNAAVDLVETDLLAGELGAATSRWNALWQEVIDTPAWERWLLGGRLAALRAEIALPTEGAEAGVEWADRAVEMARTVSRAKYEAAARATLGAALVSLGRAADAVRELTAAVDITATLGSPYGIWRARRELARALERTGNVERAERELHAAAEVIGDVAAGLSPERRERFLRAPAVAEILGSV